MFQTRTGSPKSKVLGRNFAHRCSLHAKPAAQDTHS
jgi:hypothetical protein